jgi:hypothetical protein
MAALTRPSSRAEARELVDKILESHGRPRQAVWESITEKLSEAEIRELELSFATKDRLIGSSVIT